MSKNVRMNCCHHLSSGHLPFPKTNQQNKNKNKNKKNKKKKN